MKIIKQVTACRCSITVPLVFSMLLTLSCRQVHKKNENVFRYNETTGIATLDPAFAKNQSIIWPVHQLYNTLIETDGDLNMVPSLAKSWQVSEDRKTYVFTIRDDVFFHDHPVFRNGKGRKMNAYDVEYSFKRIIDKNTASS